MPAGRDDDALTWDGDDDPTLDVGAAEPIEAADSVGPASPAPDSPAETAAAETASLPDGWSAVGKGSDSVGAAAEQDPDDAVDSRGSMEADAQGPPADEPIGNGSLIALGVFGGFSVLYAIGWLIGGLRLQDTAQFLVAPVAYQVSLWLAVLAPIVWFGTVYLLTSASRAWVRFAWLVGGVLFLIPWPFIMVGAIGQ